MEINFPSDYVMWTETTALYPRQNIDQARDYESLGLISEVGEVAAMLKRKIRDGKEIDRMDLMLELGDVAWYLARLHYDHVNNHKDDERFEFVKDVTAAFDTPCDDDRTCLGAVVSTFNIFRPALRKFTAETDKIISAVMESPNPILGILEQGLKKKLTKQELFLTKIIPAYSTPDGLLLNLLIDKCYEVDGILYFCFLCDRFNFDVMEVLRNNVYKLESRRERGKLQGAGDHR